MTNAAKLDKLYYKIGEVSSLTGLEPYVLRYWEKEFPTLKPKKNRGGHRIYTQEDIESGLDIKRLLYKAEFTIEGARRQLQKSNEARSVRGEHLEKEIEEVKAVLRTVRKEIQDLCEMFLEESVS